MVLGRDLSRLDAVCHGALPLAIADTDAGAAPKVPTSSTAVALLAAHPHPTDADIDALEDVCRCGTYVRIRRAIHRAAGG